MGPPNSNESNTVDANEWFLGILSIQGNRLQTYL